MDPTQQNTSSIESPEATNTSLNVLIEQFQNALIRRKYPEAIQIADFAISHHARLPYPFVLKAIALRQNGDFRAALQALNHSLDLGQTPEAIIELAQLSRDTGNQEEAEKLASYIRNSFPELASRLYNPSGMVSQNSLEPPNQVTKAIDQLTFNQLAVKFMPIKKAKISQFLINDICLTSYPRSGNTWMREQISHALLLSRGIDTKPGELPIARDSMVPDLHRQDLSESWPGHNGFDFRVFKSHDPVGVARQPIIYVYRNPLDSLVSYFHYHHRKNLFENPQQVTADLFCSVKCQEYIAHLSTALKLKKAVPERILILSYERIFSDTFSTLSETLKFIGVSLPDNLVRKAVQHSQFDDLQRKESPEKVQGMRFFRVGRPGTGRMELKPETVELIESQTCDILNEMRQCEGLTEAIA